MVVAPALHSQRGVLYFVVGTSLKTNRPLLRNVLLVSALIQNIRDNGGHVFDRTTPDRWWLHQRFRATEACSISWLEPLSRQTDRYCAMCSLLVLSYKISVTMEGMFLIEQHQIDGGCTSASEPPRRALFRGWNLSQDKQTVIAQCAPC